MKIKKYLKWDIILLLLLAIPIYIIIAVMVLYYFIIANIYVAFTFWKKDRIIRNSIKSTKDFSSTIINM